MAVVVMVVVVAIVAKKECSPKAVQCNSTLFQWSNGRGMARIFSGKGYFLCDILKR